MKISYSWKKLVQDMWVLLKGRRLFFFWYTLLKSISDLIPFLTTYMLGKIVDFIVAYTASAPLAPFYYLVLAIALAGSFQVWLRFYAKIKLQTLGAQLRKQTRETAMSTLFEADLRWHDKQDTGSKIQKINQGGENIFEVIHTFSNQGISISTAILGSLFIFISLNWKYALFGFLYTLIYLSAESYFNHKISYWQDRLSKAKEKVSGKMHESISNLLTIKSVGMQESMTKSMSAQEQELYALWVASRNVVSLKFQCLKIFSALCYAGFILLVGIDTIAGVVSIGSILVFVNYFGKLRDATHDLTDNAGDFLKIKSAVGRLMAILDVNIVAREYTTRPVDHSWQKVEFENVSFSYKRKLVLDNISFSLVRGEKIGLVGSSGSGKSTVVKLLLGLYTPHKGSITIDRTAITEYKHSSLTSEFNVVMQDTEVFNLSLQDNIALPSQDQDPKKIQQVLQLSGLTSVVQKLPQGTKTLLGEKGYHLSGGERQRVGIARALYKKGSLLILDEATSHLDSKTERMIQEHIEEQFKDKTMLIIAHRLSTLQRVNRIMVMDRGKIVEQGTFAELVAKKGYFYELYKLQKSKV